MTKYRNVKVYNAAGDLAHTRHVPITEHRVRFGKTSWDLPLPTDAVNRRTVRLDGEDIGVLYGVDVSPYNANRPTAYRFIAAGGDWMETYDRLDSARGEIARVMDARKARAAAADGPG